MELRIISCLLQLLIISCILINSIQSQTEPIYEEDEFEDINPSSKKKTLLRVLFDNLPISDSLYQWEPDYYNKYETALRDMPDENLSEQSYKIVRRVPLIVEIGSTSYLFSERKFHWKGALRTCNAGGAKLVSFEDISKLRAVQKFFDEYEDIEYSIYWTSANEIKHYGEFTWLSGRKLNYSNWMPGHPVENRKYPHCVEVDFRSDGKYLDIPCSRRRQFICERKKIVPPTEPPETEPPETEPPETEPPETEPPETEPPETEPPETEPPTTQPPETEPPTTEPPTTEPPTTEPPTTEPPTTEPPTTEPPTTEPPTTEPPTTEPPTTEPPTTEPPTTEPPTTEPPETEPPETEPPETEPPETEPPETEPPETEPPETEPPETEPPETEPPATEPPETEPPATEPPTTQPPTTQPPTTQPPTTQPPTTQPPTTHPPTTHPPPTQPPTTQPPTTQPPTTHPPTTHPPTTHPPTTQPPATQPPAEQHPTLPPGLLVIVIVQIAPLVVRINERFYLFWDFARMNWEDANQFCDSKDMELVSIEDELQLAELIFFVSSYEFESNADPWSDSLYWTSGHKSAKSGQFIWSSTNESFSYNHWRRNEPNNWLGQQNCVEVDLSTKLLYNDVSCLVERYPLCSKWASEVFVPELITTPQIESSTSEAAPLPEPATPLPEPATPLPEPATPLPEPATPPDDEEEEEDSTVLEGDATKPYEYFYELYPNGDEEDENAEEDGEETIEDTYFYEEDLNAVGNSSAPKPKKQKKKYSVNYYVVSENPLEVIVNRWLYLIEADKKLTKAEAEVYCQSRHMTLASVETRAKSVALTVVLRSEGLVNVPEAADKFRNVFWTSGVYRSDVDDWWWGRNQSFSYENWLSGQPNNYGGVEDCLVIGYKKVGQWNDDDCEKERNVICQLEVTPIIHELNDVVNEQSSRNAPVLADDYALNRKRADEGRGHRQTDPVEI